SEERRGTNPPGEQCFPQYSSARVVQSGNSDGTFFRPNGFGIQDGVRTNQALEAFDGKAEGMQCLLTRVVIHVSECDGLSFEVTTKLYSKKLDLIAEICLFNLSEAHFFSKFKLVGVKTMFDGIPIAGLSATFTDQC
ncbi:MAG TPA: hypothetical protein VF359_03395, partial [Anaerolineales bacterium]